MLFCISDLELLPEVCELLRPNVFEARTFFEILNKL
jgi:hypothetical protein